MIRKAENRVDSKKLFTRCFSEKFPVWVKSGSNTIFDVFDRNVYSVKNGTYLRLIRAAVCVLPTIL